MKIRLLAVMASTVLCCTFAKATDYCVNENGNNGCYSTITAAVNAAANGDRIIIEPKAGHAPYVENLSIAKSLYLICANDTDKFDVMGTITITPAIGRSITIIGMHIVGSVTQTGSSPAGARCSVSILGGNIEGNIDFNADNYNVTVASNIITNGYVGLRFGKVIGNDITCVTGLNTGAGGAAISYATDAQATNDTNLVIGNIIRLNSAGYCYGICMNSTSQYAHLMNNLMLCGASAAGYAGGIYFYQFKSSAVSRNLVINNTVYSPVGVSMGIGFGPGAPANAYTDVINNLVIAASCAYGSFWNATGTIGMSYNYYTINPVASTDPCSCNVWSNNLSVDANGHLQAGSDGINQGSPDYSYYDLNLTINDVGAWGGSYSLENFFPISGRARVFLVQAPRRVNVSGTINIKAESFDR